MESYKHKLAKDVVAQWLGDATPGYPPGEDERPLDPLSSYILNRSGELGEGDPPTACRPRIETEFAFVLTENNKLKRGEHVLPDLGRQPTYDELIKAGALPVVIFDIVCLETWCWNDGGCETIAFAVEIVHTHPISEKKKQYVKRIQKESILGYFPVYSVNADWALSQCCRPKKIKFFGRI